MSRYYAIGDIHGRLDMLLPLLAEIEADAARKPGECIAVFLGDYVDRGPESKEVIALLRSGKALSFPYVCLKGNHEDMMVSALSGVDQPDHWLSNGGGATVASYRGAEQKMADDARWMDGLPTSHTAPGLMFVHAGVVPGVPLDKQDPDDLMWIRTRFLASEADHGAIIIHGHTPNEDVEFMPNRVCVDTGACFRGGKLSCLIIDGATPHSAISYNGEKIVTTFPRW